MKRIFLIFASALLALALVACGGDMPVDTTDETATAEVIDVIDEGYKVVYDITDSTAIATMTQMLGDINTAVGAKPASSNSGAPATQKEIQFGLKSGRDEAASLYGEIMKYANAQRGVYAIRVVGEKIVVSASDKDALKIAASVIAGFAEGGKLLVPKNLDMLAVYDTDAYLRQGTVEMLDADAIGADAGLKSLSVNGTPVLGFSRDKTDYAVAVEGVSSVNVSAITSEAGAAVSVKTEGNTTTVVVISIDGKNERVYTVKAYEKLESEVVNKDGAKAIVTYVIDDGNKETATFIKEKMAPKYPSLTASFALITKNLATLDIKTNDDGTREYAKDADGFYTYKKNESNWAFWQDIAATLGAEGYELVSHTHTHSYWGENDNGGTFKYYNTAGDEFVSEDFPKGNVSKEFLASQQIIQDLDPNQTAYTFVRSGLTAGGKNVKYSDTFWDAIQNSGAYIGARGTYTYPDRPLDMINKFETFANVADRFFLKSYMVQHYNTSPTVKTTQADSGPAECLAAGIPYWTNYIDVAVENNAWAAFCIHTIKPDTYDTRSGHYIYESQADELFAYTEKLAAENKVWVANLTDAFVYVNERSTATVESYVDESGNVVVSLDDREEGSVYNMALTVKVALPDGKNGATVDGKALTAFSENGKTYVYVNVVPGNTATLEVK